MGVFLAPIALGALGAFFGRGNANRQALGVVGGIAAGLALAGIVGRAWRKRSDAACPAQTDERFGAAT